MRIATEERVASLPVPLAHSVMETSRSTMDRYLDVEHFYPLAVCPVVAKRSYIYDTVDWDLASAGLKEPILGLKVHPGAFTFHTTANVEQLQLSLASSCDKALLGLMGQFASVAFGLTDHMTPSPEHQPKGASVSAELKRSLGRLNYLRSLSDGWLGADSLGATNATGREAAELLKRLHHDAPSAPLPVLGLDTDGTIVMSWSQQELVGSMTIYGDGTYSYFVRRGRASAEDVEALIEEPLGENLRLLLEG